MKTYQFAIIASGPNPNADDFEDRFFEAGCDDATISFQKGLIILEFSRESRSFAHAIASAFANVHKAGAKVERFEPDHLVNLSDIAQRSGMSKAAISLYCKGERAEGFPAPVARVTSESPLWDWVDVTRWMHKHDKIGADVVLEARLVREANIITRGGIPHDRFAKHLEEIATEAA
ncbi:MAG: hypothetical protein KGO02_17190 [Alphaproteobacteria bacterium]|nr:hypothetical protein [Alphaproteobacteria bacterium]